MLTNDIVSFEQLAPDSVLCTLTWTVTVGICRRHLFTWSGSFKQIESCLVWLKLGIDSYSRLQKLSFRMLKFCMRKGSLCHMATEITSGTTICTVNVKISNTLFHNFFAKLLLLMHLFLKILLGVMANSVDPDKGTVWSGSAMFAYANLSETLVYQNFRTFTIFNLDIGTP